MHILVAGGAGFIGSHVCKVLSESGFTPVVYDNLSTGHSWAVRFGPFVQGDLEDEGRLLEAFEQYAPKAVIHLASLINVRDSLADPGLYYEKNLFSTLSLLRAMKKAGIFHLVFSSTAAIYGTPQTIPIDEMHPKNPLNAYGKTKWAIEAMLEDFSHAHGLRFVILRYFNACGADPTSLIGEAHDPETHLIPLVVQTALGFRDVLQIYGDDHPTSDGTAVRDYVHVLDLADAHIKALHSLFTKGACLTLNLGTGTGYSVRQIIDAASFLGKREIPTEILPRFSHDSPILVADASLARELLGWKPRYSDLSTILSTAWNWQEKLFNQGVVTGALDRKG